MKDVIKIWQIMPRSEIVGGIMFAIGFPILFTAIWVVTP